MKDVKMNVLKSFLLFINMLVIAFILNLIVGVTKSMCLYNTARTFLDGVVKIPTNPGMLASYTTFLMGIFVFTFIVREWIFPEKRIIIYTTLAFDFIVCIVLMYVLNFNYNGIVLWVFANVIYHIKDRGRYWFLILAIVMYVVTDHQLLSIKYNLFSVKSYMMYFEASRNQYYLGMFNLLVSMNIVVFIVYCALVIQRQRGIIEEVNSLYDRLTYTNEELQYANSELKKYADLKEKMGQTKERNRLAREIHDTLGHTLTGISAGLDACIATIDDTPEMTKKQLNTLSNVTRTGINEVRRSVNELRPDALERLSLKSAIERMIEESREVTKAEIKFQCETNRLKFDEDEENTIYRIIQESITNAIRHGRAHCVNVEMKQELDNIHLVIQDNGSGCRDMKMGFGTKHMQERVKMLNGTISFYSENGFIVEAVIPIRWGEVYD